MYVTTIAWVRSIIASDIRKINGKRHGQGSTTRVGTIPAPTRDYNPEPGFIRTIQLIFIRRTGRTARRDFSALALSVMMLFEAL